MHLQVCEHPTRIFDKRLHMYRYVPCGKCAMCINTKNAQWVSRLDTEIQCWKYSAFFTLTYDEAHVPQFLFTKDNLLYDFKNDFVVDPYEVKDFNPHSYVYLHRRKRINYVSVKDIQLFVKRFRYYAAALNDCYENNILRYFIAAEYGPTTLRPHYHGIFFFNSKTTAQNFTEMLSKSWPYGNVNWSFVKSSASEYVAKYVNCTYSLPKVYQHRELRPFALCSKCPPLGTLHYNSKEVFEIFDRGIVEHREFSTKRQQDVYAPLLRSVKDSIFPKVQGFSQLTHNDRVALYGVARFSQKENFEEFRQWCEESIRPYRFLPSGWTEQLAELLCAPTIYPLKRLWETSNRVLCQSAIFGCSLDYYVSRIEQFYRHYDYYKLKNYYNFQEEFSKQYDVRSLIYLDLDFVDTMINRCRDFSPDSDLPHVRKYRMITESFGIDFGRFISDPTYRYQLSPELCPEYQRMVSNHNDILRKSSKTKVKNDYLRSHPESRIYKF